MTKKLTKLLGFDHQKLQKIKNKPNQEIMIVLNEKHNFILKKEAASKLTFFQMELLDKGLRVCFINRPFNVGSFEKIMQLISGEVCYFENTRELVQILEIGNYFGGEEMKKILVDELFKNFEKYSVFLLLQFGLKFSQTQIKEKSIYQLVSQNFEQFNFNRLSFLQCNPQMFAFLISLHFNFTKNGIIKGLSETNIKQIIKQYGSFHGLSLEKSNITIKKQQILVLEKLLKQRINYSWKEFRTPSFSLTDLSQSIDFSQSEPASRKKSLRKTSDSFRIQSDIQIWESENDGNTESSESEQIGVLLIQSSTISTSIDDNLQKQQKDSSQKVNLKFQNCDSDSKSQKIKIFLNEKENQKH